MHTVTKLTTKLLLALLLQTWNPPGCYSQRVAVQSFGPFSPTKLIVAPLSRRGDVVSEANENLNYRNFLQDNFPTLELRESSSHKTRHNHITHIYLKQLLKGIPIDNTFFHVNLDQSAKILSHSFSVAESISSTSDTIKDLMIRYFPEEALRALSQRMKFEYPVDLVLHKVTNYPMKYYGSSKKLNDRIVIVPCYFFRQIYVPKEEQIRPTWRISWRRPAKFNVLTNVNMVTKEVYMLSDKMEALTYRAIPLGKTNAPDLTILKDPEDNVASPKGWINDTITTIGNNVQAQENWDPADFTTPKYRPKGTNDLIFKWNSKLSPKENVNVSVTNLFVWINLMHDLTYHYGFTEQAGNFQYDNFGKGGKGGDPIIAYAQDTTGKDDAYFETSPDGEAVYLSIFLFDKDQRDGALSSDVIAHEFMHGVSTRLTGGSQSPSCLPWGEPLGMGEGWSDFVAILLQMTSYDTPNKEVGIAMWINGGKTIRNYMYSTNMKVNPTTYGWLNRKEWNQSPHAIGEVWANVLYEMYWNIMTAMNFRFDPNWYSADSHSGNTWTLQLVIDGLKLQPCQPTFVSARDAILEADRVGSHAILKCPIWKAFAKRGIGEKAQSVWVKGTPQIKEDFTIPSDCLQ